MRRSRRRINPLVGALLYALVTVVLAAAATGLTPLLGSIVLIGFLAAGALYAVTPSADYYRRRPDPSQWSAEARGTRTKLEREIARRPWSLASDAEREEIVDRLHAAAVEGRLRDDELEERVGQALAARTVGELDVLVDDLP